MNLRTSARLDCPYGDDASVSRDIDHRHPDDVTRDDMDFYVWCFSYRDFPSLLFYLYPIAREYEVDKGLECIDLFLYTLDQCLPSEADKLPAMHQSTIHTGFRWICASGGDWSADFAACPNLCAVIDLGGA